MHYNTDQHIFHNAPVRNRWEDSALENVHHGSKSAALFCCFLLAAPARQQQSSTAADPYLLRCDSAPIRRTGGGEPAGGPPGCLPDIRPTQRSAGLQA
jgi:hypothetical protein